GRRVVGDRGAVRWDELGQLCHVREMIARIVPGMAKLAEIDRTRKEFHITGRLLHAPTFNTPSGKASFAAIDLPALPLEQGQLRLMTVRSEGQFNTVVYEEEDVYRGQDRRDVILMSRHDIERLGLQADQRVTVRSGAGELRNILVRPYDIRAGNALM